MLDNSEEAPPLYAQIKEELKRRIKAKEYRQGEYLPRETDLQEEFGVSRITMRRAINDMVSEGYFSRTRGKGTVITLDKINEKLNRIMSFTDEMNQKGLETTCEEVIVQVVKADKQVAEALLINVGDYVFRIERVRFVNNCPLAFHITYLKLESNIPLDNSVYKGSLYVVLKEHCSITIDKVNDLFEAIIASDDICERLKIAPGSPVFKRDRISYQASGETVEYTICYYRGDKYKCSIEMS